MSPSSDAGPSHDTAPSADTTVEVEVLLPAHLHARPAGRLVQVAAGFAATVDIAYGDRSASARSILAVLALGATAGTTVGVRASGPDADAAARAVAGVLAAAE
jgi:phosphotransferase system HPr (HPr) family protein